MTPLRLRDTCTCHCSKYGRDFLPLVPYSALSLVLPQYRTQQRQKVFKYRKETHIQTQIYTLIHTHTATRKAKRKQIYPLVTPTYEYPAVNYLHPQSNLKYPSLNRHDYTTTS